MRRNYWIYSVGLAVAWAVVIVLSFLSSHEHGMIALYVFGGFLLAWVSGTIARYVYPPPEKWTRSPQSR